MKVAYVRLAMNEEMRKKGPWCIVTRDLAHGNSIIDKYPGFQSADIAIIAARFMGFGKDIRMNNALTTEVKANYRYKQVQNTFYPREKNKCTVRIIF